ncbi:hypothetical protein ACH5RR_009803 [Cinchona calisaya]|uniref:Carboxypeptidase n=1 Tax=Cinchona calisaya TaxID=153742 RepID=A0ABD3AFA1_9GENT
MAESHVFTFPFLPAIFFVPLFFGASAAVTEGTQDGSEHWGYVEVRPKAHMFWWYYRSPYKVEDANNPWPVILWLQGGPGASGVGVGNFKEIGPLDLDLKPRNSTWLQIADLLFVDNPVGTGYSYVEERELLVKTDVEVATDLTTFLINFFNENESLQKSPLYVFAESYGGKYAATLGLSAFDAIEAGKLKVKLAGIALGDSWISPEDFVISWGPFLYDVSRLDYNGLEKSVRMAEQIKKQVNEGKFKDATSLWNELLSVIEDSSNQVDFYNFLLDVATNTLSLTAPERLQTTSMKNSRHMDALGSSLSSSSLRSLMNGVIRKKLRIIPDDVNWGGQSTLVVAALDGDFLKPRIREVDALLAKGVNMTVYNGQLDVICATKGTEAWMAKLKWDGLRTFLNMDRTPMYCADDKATKGFVKSYRNLRFYWILGAGHYVPVDQPCVALEMVASIIQSPLNLKKSNTFPYAYSI